MLKNKINSIRKELEKLSANQPAEIYFVEVKEDDFLVKTNQGDLIFQGEQEAYESFIKKHHKSYFIKMDIPRPN